MIRYVWSALVALLVLIGVDVSSRVATHSKRRLQRELAADVASFDRYIDMGVELRVVVADDHDGEHLLDPEGGTGPKLRVVRTHHMGGVLDAKASPPKLVRISECPVVWYCSEDQEPVILHGDDAPLGQLVYGSEGSGKSTAIAMWLYCRWLELLGDRPNGGAQGREMGCCAPTKKRLKMVRDELFKLWPRRWWKFKKSLELVVLADGTTIQFVSTKKQSTAGGSPLQGFNWSAAAQDELQDQDDEVHDDIGQRCRSAKNGRAKRIASCTAKDTSAFRNRRDRMLGSGSWVKRVMLIARSPFISRAFILQRQRELSPREFARRFEALDLPPDLAEYPSWNRTENLLRITIDSFGGEVLPAGWEDCTVEELAPWGDNLSALAGHDPGSICDVTIILKAYRRTRWVVDDRGHRSRYTDTVWVVVDEITTYHTTTEQHVAELLERLRPRLTDGRKILVRADPYGNNDAKPDRATYTIFRNAGAFVVHPAAYAADGKKPGRVPKNEGIEVVNTLLCNAAQERRMFVAVANDNTPIAPNLVRAFEENERDEKGRAEQTRKGEDDLSHWPAALRYALWAIERPRLLRRKAAA